MNAPNFREWPNLNKGFVTPEEAEVLWKVCIEKQPKQILEIGRRMGMSTALFGLVAKESDGRVFSVDGIANPNAEKLLERHGIRGRVRLINDWSPWVQFDFSWDLDFLYIDGDHRYISTVVDYHVFNYFVKTGGYIAFHDSKYPYVKRAIDEVVKRDKLKPIAEQDQLTVWQKTDKERRVYYQFSNTEFKVK